MTNRRDFLKNLAQLAGAVAFTAYVSEQLRRGWSGRHRGILTISIRSEHTVISYTAPVKIPTSDKRQRTLCVG